MNLTATTHTLIRNLVDAGVLDASQQAELVQLPDLAPRALAHELQRRGWISPFQAPYIALGNIEELLVGNYLLLSKLGEGGMGEVFKARQRSMNRIVALKVLRAESQHNERLVARFQREVRAMSQFQHPNIVQAFDAGRAGDRPFIALEYIDGLDLGRHIKYDGPLAVIQAVDFARQTSLALEAVHEHGMVHRDIKPANLLVALIKDTANYPFGIVKLLDLGLARWLDDGVSLTQTGAVIGTADFLAPEQALDSRNCDIRADIYGLGCTVYYLLAGRVPYPNGSFTEKLMQHQTVDAEPIHVVRRQRWDADRERGKCDLPENELPVPPAVENIVRKMMAKKPEQRYQTPKEMTAALEAVQRALTGELLQRTPVTRKHPAPITFESITLPKATPSARKQPAPITLDSFMLPTRPPREERGRGRRRRLIVFVVACLLAVASAAAASVWFSSSHDDAKPSNTDEVEVLAP